MIAIMLLAYSQSLPLLGSLEAALRSTYDRELKVAPNHRTYQMFEVQRIRVSSLPALARFEMSPRTRRLYRIRLSMKGSDRCHIYEAIIRKPRGKPDDAEWGTRAYELTWKAKGSLPATHFWLYAYDGKNTRCDVTFGPRA